MASILKILLKFLRICRLAGKNILSRWSVLITFLRRMLCEWHRKPGTFQNTKSAESSSPGNMKGRYSVSDGSAAVKECVVSASTVPASGRDPSGVRFELRSATAEAAPSSPTRNPATQRSTSSNRSVSSFQSRASDRLSLSRPAHSGAKSASHHDFPERFIVSLGVVQTHRGRGNDCPGRRAALLPPIGPLDSKSLRRIYPLPLLMMVP
ncbi:hypothetical protein F5148DRAFT_814892 [Russula earlei]|uniref:Uncharacterized protein n=1 Tax=Russula earlei TaxID=71964 RepID=A0ACC0UD92_9AGAM|nr:hypothetical protein F5148DRAFT_814892 [Russula earlei]